MGCECCKTVNASDYEVCQKRKEKNTHGFTAPCGVAFGGKFTLPRKKKKRRR